MSSSALANIHAESRSSQGRNAEQRNPRLLVMDRLVMQMYEVPLLAGLFSTRCLVLATPSPHQGSVNPVPASAASTVLSDNASRSGTEGTGRHALSAHWHIVEKALCEFRDRDQKHAVAISRSALHDTIGAAEVAVNARTRLSWI